MDCVLFLSLFLRVGVGWLRGRGIQNVSLFCLYAMQWECDGKGKGNKLSTSLAPLDLLFFCFYVPGGTYFAGLSVSFVRFFGSSSLLFFGPGGALGWFAFLNHPSWSGMGGLLC